MKYLLNLALLNLIISNIQLNETVYHDDNLPFLNSINGKYRSDKLDFNYLQSLTNGRLNEAMTQIVPVLKEVDIHYLQMKVFKIKKMHFEDAKSLILSIRPDLKVEEIFYRD